MSTENDIERLRALLTRLEEAVAQLDAVEDPAQAIDVLDRLASMAKEVQVEIDQARHGEPDAPA